MFGRMLDERLGKLHFWLVFIGFNLTFMPQHLLGLLGMPRRVYTYSEGGLWEVYNMISTIGSFMMAVGMLVFVVNIVRTVALAGGARSTTPGSADTLEWYATSPPPPWNFDRDPLHHQRAAAARPAPAARPARAGCDERALGAAARGRRRSPGPALAVVSGAADWHTAHRAARRARAAAARRAARRSPGSRPGRSCPPRSRALVLFGLAALLTETRRPPRRWPRSRSPPRRCSAAQAFRGEPSRAERASATT